MPVWTRLAAPANAAAAAREKFAPPPPKVYRAVQAKTMSLGLGGPDDGGFGGLVFGSVADPAAPYYGVEPGAGSGAAAAAGRMGFGMGRGAAPNAAVAAAAAAAAAMAARGNGGSSTAGLYGLPMYGEEMAQALESRGGMRRAQDSPGVPYGAGAGAGGGGGGSPLPGPGHGGAGGGGLGPSAAFMRARRLQSGASPGRVGAAPAGPGLPMTSGAGAGGGGGGGGGAVGGGGARGAQPPQRGASDSLARVSGPELGGEEVVRLRGSVCSRETAQGDGSWLGWHASTWCCVRGWGCHRHRDLTCGSLSPTMLLSRGRLRLGPPLPEPSLINTHARSSPCGLVFAHTYTHTCTHRPCHQTFRTM